MGLLEPSDAWHEHLFSLLARFRSSLSPQNSWRIMIFGSLRTPIFTCGATWLFQRAACSRISHEQLVSSLGQVLPLVGALSPNRLFVPWSLLLVRHSSANLRSHAWSHARYLYGRSGLSFTGLYLLLHILCLLDGHWAALASRG